MRIQTLSLFAAAGLAGAGGLTPASAQTATLTGLDDFRIANVGEGLFGVTRRDATNSRFQVNGRNPNSSDRNYGLWATFDLELDGLFSVNDIGSLGALIAINSSGNDIKLVSVDGHPEAVAEIQKDDSQFIATSAQYPADMVRVGLGLALAKHWGAETAPAEIPIDVELIDRDKAADFSW